MKQEFTDEKKRQLLDNVLKAAAAINLLQVCDIEGGYIGEYSTDVVSLIEIVGDYIKNIDNLISPCI